MIEGGGAPSAPPSVSSNNDSFAAGGGAGEASLGVGSSERVDVIAQLHSCLSGLLHSFDAAQREMRDRAVVAGQTVDFKPTKDNSDVGGIGLLSQSLARERGAVATRHVGAIVDVVNRFNAILDDPETEWMDRTEADQLERIRKEEQRSAEALGRIQAAVKKSTVLLEKVRSLETSIGMSLMERQVFNVVPDDS